MFDYSKYVPRGHYTRTDQLKNYFLAMLWLGDAGIELSNELNIISSVLITNILYTKTYEGELLINLWKDVYEPTAFYVGVSDDTGPLEIKEAMDIVFSGMNTLEDFDHKEKLLSLVQLLPSEKISGGGSWGTQKKQFRLMGQRFIPDSYIFHRLTNFERRVPNSLDIMAGFGNEKAYELMMNQNRSSWENFLSYPDSLNRIIIENKKMTSKDWTKNLYYHWLYNLNSLYEVKRKNDLPFFMTTEGWEIKTLNTSLSSWAELRHNTILYSKESVVAECGGGEPPEMKMWIPEPPKGYVEPNIEFYERMLSLMHLTIDGLEQRKMLDANVKFIGDEFINLLIFLKSVSEKENKKEPLNLAEYEQIQKVGSQLERLTLGVLSEEATDWTSIEGPDKNMPVIADVHTADATALEVGVGKAHAMYVIVEIEGKLKLTRGAIFSFYEFTWPSSDRLSDEKWQEILKEDRQPEQPSWINYKSNQKKERKLYPLYKPTLPDAPDSSPSPGWQIILYDTGC
jgi:hypothetical protein